MTEEYVKIICDRCGKDVLIKKIGFPDNITSYHVPDDEKWSLKDKVRFQIYVRNVGVNTKKCFINFIVKE